MPPEYIQLDSAEGAPPLWVIPGWGIAAEIMLPWLRDLQTLFSIRLLKLPFQSSVSTKSNRPKTSDLPRARLEEMDIYLDGLKDIITPGSILLGWSLGGNMAIEFALRYPEKVQVVITLATNPKFCQGDDWKAAMPLNIFQGFRHQAMTDMEKTLTQFHGLCVSGDGQKKQQLKQIKKLDFTADADLAVDWLDCLAAFDQREAASSHIKKNNSKLSIPLLMIFSDGDALVPAAVTDSLTGIERREEKQRDEKQVASWIAVIKNAGHMPFLSQPGQCSSYVIRFLQQSGVLEQRDKTDVARSFSRAAKSYDDAAELQLQVADKLLVMFRQAIDVSQSAGDCVLDLGCGNGRVSFALQSMHYDKSVIGLDLAEGMLLEARQRVSIPLLAGDAEQLPLQDSSVAAMFSSLVIQWCEDLDSLFAEMYRVMQPGAVATLSTLGPDTLWQLREAWATIDYYEHVNRFYPVEILQGIAVSAGFEVSIEEECLEYFFPDAGSLMRSLKEIGAQNSSQYRLAGLMGKSKFRQLASAYEEYRSDEGLPAGYQVYYLSLQKR